MDGQHRRYCPSVCGGGPGSSHINALRQDFSADAPGPSATRNARIPILPDQVHVWSLPTDVRADTLRRLERVLSAEELSRAGRFVFAVDRRRHIAAHGLMRAVLANYLGLLPQELRFEAGSHGKPRLPIPQPLRFNLTHSGSLALLAVSADREVGVDVEQVRDIGYLESLVDACFSPVERAKLASLPAPWRLRAFFLGWTRKEAFLKALGAGLIMPLDSFDVELTPGEPARILRVQGVSDPSSTYALAALEPEHGYVGALAVVGPRLEVCWRRWVGPSTHHDESESPTSRSPEGLTHV